MPWMMNAPMSTAVTSSPGMPRVSMGIMAEPVVALLPASGAAMPSMAPCPNFSGCLEVRRASE